MDIDAGFHPLVEGTSAAILVFDVEQIRYINPASKTLTGRTARELLGRPFLDLVHPHFRSRYQSPAALSAGSHDQIQIVRKNGTARWVELWLQPVLFRGNAATLATIFDVHDLKESDLARREAEVQLKLVQRAGKTVSWDWRVGADELTIYGLPQNLLTHGAPALTTTARAFFDRVVPEDLVHLKQAIRRSVNDREPLFLEIGILGSEGKRFWIVVRGQAVSERDGMTDHLVGVATDISDRRRAAEVLVQEQERSLAMLASVSDGVIRTDLEGRIIDLSDSAERILDQAREEAHGRLLKSLVTFHDQATGEILEDPVDHCLLDDAPLLHPQPCLVRRADGEELPLEVHAALLRDHDSTAIGIVLVLKNPLEHHEHDRGMVYLATHDPLTNLVNRTEFERQLGNSIVESRKPGRQDSLLYLDLDGFELMNETYGYPAGDKMLQQFASFLQRRFRETDTLARLGRDRFAVLLENCTISQARELTDKLYQDLASFRFDWAGHSLPARLSTGLAAVGSAGDTVEKTLAAAEAACHLAKQRGGDRLHEYQPEDPVDTDRHTQLEILHQIQDSIQNGSFELHGQRVVPLASPDSNPEMYEVLVRIRDRQGNLVLPGRFIPVAEKHHIVSAIDRWVLSRCISLLGEIRSDDALRLCLNISGQSLGDEQFLEFVLHEFSSHDIEPGHFLFEITETATVTNFDRAQRFIAVLRERGCGFVLDDFGSGLSSFAYLRNFPVDFIKIDGQFVRGLSKDSTQRALVESINHVGHVMQIRTIAECVEDNQTRDLLQAMKVDYAQGHSIESPQNLEALLQSHGQTTVEA